MKPGTDNPLFKDGVDFTGRPAIAISEKADLDLIDRRKIIERLSAAVNEDQT